MRAGPPRGSASNAFRTRSALLTGVSDEIVRRESTELSTWTPGSADAFVEGCCLLLGQVTIANRTLTAARRALFLEASHEPALAEPLNRGRAALAATMRQVLAGLGAPDPARGAAP